MNINNLNTQKKEVSLRKRVQVNCSREFQKGRQPFLSAGGGSGGGV